MNKHDVNYLFIFKWTKMCLVFRRMAPRTNDERRTENGAKVFTDIQLLPTLFVLLNSSFIHTSPSPSLPSPPTPT